MSAHDHLERNGIRLGAVAFSPHILIANAHRLAASERNHADFHRRHGGISPEEEPVIRHRRGHDRLRLDRGREV